MRHQLQRNSTLLFIRSLAFIRSSSTSSIAGILIMLFTVSRASMNAKFLRNRRQTVILQTEVYFSEARSQSVDSANLSRSHSSLDIFATSSSCSPVATAARVGPEPPGGARSRHLASRAAASAPDLSASATSAADTAAAFAAMSPQARGIQGQICRGFAAAAAAAAAANAEGRRRRPPKLSRSYEPV